MRTGGTQNLLLRHVRALAEKFPDTDNVLVVLGTWGEDKRLQAHFRTVESLSFSGCYRRPVESTRCILNLRKLVRRHAPDVLHSYLWNANVFSAMALWGLDPTHLVHIVDRRGGLKSGRLSGRLRARLTAGLLRGTRTRFVAVSDACREFAIDNSGFPDEQIFVAKNGIYTREFNSRRTAPSIHFRFGILSNIVAEKGHLVLLDAFQSLVKAGCQAELLIAGDGPLRTLVDDRIKERGLSSRVSLLGRVDDSAEFYSSIDAFLVPSLYAEGLPTTLLEAMASGLPVIATNVGGAKEVIENGTHGLLVPPKDSGALSSAMSELVESKGFADQLASKGLQRVESDFDIYTMTAEIVRRGYRVME